MIAADELIAELFCGGGGASEGIRQACGRGPDIAIDYDAHAIETHAANHEDTRHYLADVMEIDPLDVCCDRKVGLLWLSPSCTDFSRAKGYKLVSAKIRALGWSAIKWAEAVRPRMIFLENVPEFRTWGPLIDPGVELSFPDPSRVGDTYRLFIRRLREMAYDVEEAELNCADYGAPTMRKRYFMIARCDGKPIRWPKPTHGPDTDQPHLTASDCVDWLLECRSIFGREKDLADNTHRRIAAGLVRYVINDENPYIVEQNGLNPFIVQTAHGDHADRPGFRGQSIHEPMRVVTGSKTHAVVTPIIVKSGERHMRGNRRIDKPYDTVMPTQRAALVAPVMTRMGHGDKQWNSVREPVGTVCTGKKHALVSAFLAKNYTGIVGCKVEKPIGSITGKDHHSLVTAHLTKFRGGNKGNDVRKPMPTVTSGSGAKRPAGAAPALGLIAATLITTGHGERKGQAPRVPGLKKPLGTVCATASNHALVAAFLTKYYGEGSISQQLRDPLHTIVSKARFGLVTVTLAGEDWVIVDIGLRMLQPHELALAQGFPSSYIFPGTLAERTARIGNSVCPPMAKALVAANIAA